MSKFNTPPSTPVKVAIAVWLVFCSLYLVRSEYGRVQAFIAKKSYNAGVLNSVGTLITESKKCQPIKVNVGNGQQTALLNVSCLDQNQAQQAEPAQSETQSGQ